MPWAYITYIPYSILWASYFLLFALLHFFGQHAILGVAPFLYFHYLVTAIQIHQHYCMPLLLLIKRHYYTVHMCSTSYTLFLFSYQIDISYLILCLFIALKLLLPRLFSLSLFTFYCCSYFCCHTYLHPPLFLLCSGLTIQIGCIRWLLIGIGTCA